MSNELNLKSTTSEIHAAIARHVDEIDRLIRDPVMGRGPGSVAWHMEEIKALNSIVMRRMLYVVPSDHQPKD